VIALRRETWIIASFVVLSVAGVTLSVCGWILFWRDRRYQRELEENF
jgi:hypothetical protein